jgi:translation initiation factor 2 gamma subunit (eIF-2gamma)
METAEELQSTIKNIRYYASKINELTKEQFEKDLKTKDVSVVDAPKRLDLLAAMNAAAATIDCAVYNLKATWRLLKK